jgi:hypothetical protein
MVTSKKLHQEIENIRERNKKVELDKAWETSWTRRLLLLLLTYITIVLFFLIAKLPRPFINSTVPTLGFVLSTLSLPFFKNLWMKYKSKK